MVDSFRFLGLGFVWDVKGGCVGGVVELGSWDYVWV